MNAPTPHTENLPTNPHPCSYYVPTTPTTGRTLNAISTPAPNDHAARRARQLRQCERLAEIAMELTEAARVEALKEFQPPPPRRSYAMPGMPNLILPDPAPFGRSTIFNDLVMQLSRCARQAILLETRIEAGAVHPTPPQLATSDATTRHHASAQCRTGDHMRLVHERLEDDLAADANRNPADILADIAAKLGDAIESGLLPDRPSPATEKAPGAPTTPPHRLKSQPPLTQADRARQQYLQQGTPPPTRPG